MIKRLKKPARGRMIHIRLHDEIHRSLKMYAVRYDTTVQSVVENLIREKLVKDSESSHKDSKEGLTIDI